MGGGGDERSPHTDDKLPGMTQCACNRIIRKPLPPPLSQCKYKNRRNVSTRPSQTYECIHGDGMGAMHRSVRYYFNVLVGIVEIYKKANKDKTLALFLIGTGIRFEYFLEGIYNQISTICSCTDVFIVLSCLVKRGKIPAFFFENTY